MPRAATTTDVFNAIAETRRRQILDLLSVSGPRPVGALVKELDAPQPTVSKHLAVLRKVGLVQVTKQGQQRLYRVDPGRLRPVHDWVKQYERFWTRQLDRIQQRAERMASEPREANKESNKGQGPS